MPTTGPINTTILGIYVGGTKINKAQGGSLNIDHSVRDVTTKDSAGWQEFLEGLRSWSMSASGLLDFSATYGIEDLDDIITGRTSVTVRFSTEVTGDTYFEGSAYMTNLTPDSPGQEETGTWSCEFQGTGALTVGTVS